MKNLDFPFVLWIPIINVLATLTTNYYPAGTFNPGTIRAVLIGVFLIYFLLKKFNVTLINNLILGFLIYLFILVLLSSNRTNGLYVYMRLFLTFMMFPVGYHYFYSEERFKKLHIVFAISLILFVVNIIISNIFDLGTSDYLDDTMFFGAGRVNITKAMTVLLLISPLSIQVFRRSPWIKVYGLIILFSVIIIFLGLKRSAVIALVVGFLVYMVFSPHKGTSLKLLIILSLFLYLSSFYFLDTFYQRWEARGQRVEILDENFREMEGRFNEVDMVLTDFKERTIIKRAFGVELFNEFSYYGVNRMLHTDFMILLHGSGIIGLVIYFLIWILIIQKNFRLNLKSNNILVKYNNAVIVALFIAMLFISFAGSLYAMGLRSILMLYLGAATKYNMVLIYNHKIELFYDNKKTKMYSTKYIKCKMT